MAITNWTLVSNTNFIHGIDFTSGLHLVGSFCYTTEITDGPAMLSVRNSVITNKSNIKIQAYMRKECANIEPFLFLRFDSPSCNPYFTNFAYVVKLENNLNLYKLDITDLTQFPSQIPMAQGTIAITPNTTYQVSFYSYTLVDNSTVFECAIYNGTTWVTDISHVITPDIVSGDIGFGAYYKFGTVVPGCRKAYFDNIEILSPIVFV